MTIFEAVLLGIVQGIFMFFPVSSTSHLVVVQHLLIQRGSALPSPESPEMIFFDLVVHVGTLVSIAVVFRRSLTLLTGKIWGDLAGAVGGQEEGSPRDRGLYLRLGMLGLLSVFVTGVMGLTLRGYFEQIFATPLAISGTLFLTGVLLWWTDILPRRPRGLRELTVWVALVIGFAQGLALMPGLSRSGTTIAFALFVGLKRKWAAEYSFFVAIPTILAATGVEFLSLARDGALPALEWGPLLVGFVVAALVGIFALKVVLRLLYRARFRYFSYYVWGLAALIAIGVFTGNI
jgi:undecaprenyl-diphosphatase